MLPAEPWEVRVKFGIDIPNFFDFADPETAIRLAVEAEANGWDGFFIWDHINVFRDFPGPIADPWIVLAAAAQATSRIRLGPMVTPLARRRPWKVARETVTLDRLSHGRVILGVGLGLPADTEFAAFGEDADLAIRAEKLDESLEILAGLWSGEPFEHHGKHYTVDKTMFAPTPVQDPRIPVWVAGTWGKKGPVCRAARWDGFFPMKLAAEGEFARIEPEDIREMSARFAELRAQPGEAASPFDIVLTDEVVDTTPRDRDWLRACADAGGTWWLEQLSTRHLPMEAMFDRVRQGPPQL